jgi:hypothetical protein
MIKKIFYFGTFLILFLLLLSAFSASAKRCGSIVMKLDFRGTYMIKKYDIKLTRNQLNVKPGETLRFKIECHASKKPDTTYHPFYYYAHITKKDQIKKVDSFEVMFLLQENINAVFIEYSGFSIYADEALRFKAPNIPGVYEYTVFAGKNGLLDTEFEKEDFVINVVEGRERDCSRKLTSNMQRTCNYRFNFIQRILELFPNLHLIFTFCVK